jgi:site-specific recombinase XerD
MRDEAGVGAFAQKALLEHAKLSMTDRYIHLSKEVLKKSMEGFEQQIKSEHLNSEI